jgi:hypothetical protein
VPTTSAPSGGARGALVEEVRSHAEEHDDAAHDGDDSPDGVGRSPRSSSASAHHCEMAAPVAKTTTPRRQQAKTTLDPPAIKVSVRAGAPAHLHGERFARPGPLIAHEGRGTHRAGDRDSARARGEAKAAVSVSERAARGRRSPRQRRRPFGLDHERSVPRICSEAISTRTLRTLIASRRTLRLDGR